MVPEGSFEKEEWGLCEWLECFPNQALCFVCAIPAHF